MAVRWSEMRDSSHTIIRIHLQRSGTSMPRAFSTVSTQPTLLHKGET